MHSSHLLADGAGDLICGIRRHSGHLPWLVPAPSSCSSVTRRPSSRPSSSFMASQSSLVDGRCRTARMGRVLSSKGPLCPLGLSSRLREGYLLSSAIIAWSAGRTRHLGARGPLSRLSRDLRRELPLNAAARGDPGRAKSVDSALTALLRARYGPRLIELAASGLFCFAALFPL
jgi:hypothetical protein